MFFESRLARTIVLGLCPWCCLLSTEYLFRPGATEVMKYQVYEPLKNFSLEDINKKNIVQHAKLCERSYIAYLINGDLQLYTISGQIWDRLKEVLNGDETLKQIDEGVRRLLQEYTESNSKTESDLYAQCDQLVEESLKSETE